MKFMSSAALALLAAAMLGACSSEPEATDPAAEADAFAARINAGQTGAAPAVEATVAPQIAEPLPGAVPGPFVAGAMTDPASAICGANQMGTFMGKPADEPTRLEITQALGRSDNIRFVAFGSPGYIKPDPTSPRLNLMLDAENIIRDARCG